MRFEVGFFDFGVLSDFVNNLKDFELLIRKKIILIDWLIYNKEVAH